MTKRVEAKNKICRRLGVNLWGRARNPIVKRDYPPGEHGSKRRKVSGYGQQLAAKQKLKGYYGNITERQFRRTYHEAVAAARRYRRAHGGAARAPARHDGLPDELRADGVRGAPVRQPRPRPLNGRRVTIPSYLVREGDVIEVREKSKNLALVLGTRPAARARRAGLSRGRLQGAEGHARARPKLADVPYPVQMEPNLVIEFYSR